MITVCGIDTSLAKYHIAIVRFDTGISERLTYNTVKKFVRDISLYNVAMDKKFFKGFHVQNECIDNYRYLMVDSIVRDALLKHKPQCVAVETPAYQAKSSRRSQMGYIYGTTQKIIFYRGCNYVGVTPTQLKEFVAGNCSKAQIKDKNTVLNIVSKDFKFIEDDDQADSFALACYAFSNFRKSPKFNHRMFCEMVEVANYISKHKVKTNEAQGHVSGIRRKKRTNRRTGNNRSK